MPGRPRAGGQYQECYLTLCPIKSSHPLRGATANLTKFQRQICACCSMFPSSSACLEHCGCSALRSLCGICGFCGANLPGEACALPVRGQTISGCSGA